MDVVQLGRGRKSKVCSRRTANQNGGKTINTISNLDTRAPHVTLWQFHSKVNKTMFGNERLRPATKFSMTPIGDITGSRPKQPTSMANRSAPQFWRHITKHTREVATDFLISYFVAIHFDVLTIRSLMLFFCWLIHLLVNGKMIFTQPFQNKTF